MSTVRSSRTRVLALESACDLHAVRDACRQARGFMQELGLPAEDLDAWELVLVEAANNAVQNAPESARIHPIRLEVIGHPDVVEVRLTDHTEGFDFPEVAELPDDDNESGRGLFLIRTLTDEVSYLRGAGANCLILRKRRPAAPAAATPAPDPEAALAEAQRTLDLMTEELASSYESLATIFRFSAELQSDVASDQFARRWLEQLLVITEADWFVLRLCQAGGQRLAVTACSRADWKAEPLEVQAAAGEAAPVEVRAAAKRLDVWFDPQSPLAAHDPVAPLAGQGCGIAHPVVVNDALVGVLVIGRVRGDRQFAAGQVNVIQTVADFLGIHIRNTQFREEQVRARLVTRDLEIAAGIQRSLLPQRLPGTPHASLAGFYRSAREVGGDYFDALPTGDGNLLLVVADVMGKGLPAALFALMFRSLVRARRDLAPAPGRFLAWLNHNLFQELDRANMFVTALLVYVDGARHELRVAGAGHPPLLLATATGEVIEVPSSGMPLGILADETYGEDHRSYRQARALMFTDGLVEARGESGELLGLEAVKAVLAAAAREGRSGESIKQDLTRLLHDFEQGSAPSDDTAFIAIADQPSPDHAQKDSHRG